MTTPTTPFILRPAGPCDIDDIVALIRELAEFERLTHLLEVTPERLSPQLFGERPADWNQRAIGVYQGIGATVMPDWRICRVTGDSLGALAATARS